jgi:hypothetical protein
LHQGNAGNLKELILPVATLCCEKRPFGVLKTFMSGSESRQMEAPSHMAQCSIDLREAALRDIQETNRPLCAEELEEWMGEHLPEV